MANIGVPVDPVAEDALITLLYAIPVGAGLPAMAVYQPTLMLIDPPLSLASQLLQWDCVQHGDVVFVFRHRIHRDTDIGHFDLLLADLAL